MAKNNLLSEERFVIEPERTFSDSLDSSSGMEFIQINVHKMENNALAKEIMDMIGIVVGKDNPSQGLNSVTTGDNQKSNITTAMGSIKDFMTSVGDYVNKGDYISNLGAPTEVLTLPLPNVLREVHHQLYEDSSYNLEDRMMKGGFNVLQKGMSKISNGKTDGFMESMGELTQHLMRRSNMNVDPNNIMVYDGSAPRNYTFSFNIVPQNLKEAQYYTQIIEKLKLYSAAKREQLHTSNSADDKSNFDYILVRQGYLFSFNFIRSERNANGDISSTKNKHLDTIFANDQSITKGFSLTNVTSTIGDNGLVLYDDGTPKVITLSLTFTERKPIWYDELDKYYQSKIKQY